MYPLNGNAAGLQIAKAFGINLLVNTLVKFKCGVNFFSDRELIPQRINVNASNRQPYSKCVFKLLRSPLYCR